MEEKLEKILRAGEELVWQDGNLVCLKDKKGKYRLDTKSRKSILRQKNNAWLYRKKFDYISSPENLICIVRLNKESRLLNIPSGTYLTSNLIYVLEYQGMGNYLFQQKDSEIVQSLKIENIKSWR